jgi:hypothetical protein
MHQNITLGQQVFQITYAIPPKPATVRKAVDLALKIEPGLSVSYRDSASGAWYRVTKLAEPTKSKLAESKLAEPATKE